MELTFHVHKLANCLLNIKDLSYDCGVYLDEDETTYTQLDKFKYSETYTVNIITKISTPDSSGQEEKLSKTLFTKHSFDEEVFLDEAYFTPDLDGYYMIYHYVLPSEEFLNSYQWEHSAKDKTLYYTDGCKIYRLIDGESEEVSSESMIEIEQIDDTTISKKVLSIFTICYLYECYINICKQIFEHLGSCPSCNSKTSNTTSELIFKRDFVWMTINIIRYLIEFDLLLEAERILEEIMQCNQFCGNSYSKERRCSCGCRK